MSEVPRILSNGLYGVEETCTYCMKEATSYCNQCHDFYCSRDCQLKDWNHHRHICFPLPDLIPMLSLTENGARSNESLIAQIPPLYTSESELNNNNINQNKNDDKKIVKNSQHVMKDTESTAENEEVHLPQNKINFEYSGERVLKRPFAQVPLMVGMKNVKVHLLNMTDVENGTIWCITENDYSIHLAELENQLRSFKPTVTRYSPVKGEFCLGRIIDQWNRCQCISVGNNGFKVHYIDYGLSETLTSDEIHPYPINLCIPWCTNHCVIQNGLAMRMFVIGNEWSFFGFMDTITIDEVIAYINGVFIVNMDSWIKSLLPIKEKKEKKQTCENKQTSKN